MQQLSRWSKCCKGRKGSRKRGSRPTTEQFTSMRGAASCCVRHSEMPSAAALAGSPAGLSHPCFCRHSSRMRWSRAAISRSHSSWLVALGLP